MNDQEAFTKMRDHLLEQKVRSGTRASRSTYTCLYRGPNGLKCAVGCLIPDSEYLDKFEGKSASDLVELELPSLKDLDKDLLDRVQIMHDRCDSDWEEELRAIAKEFGLVWE